MKTKIRTVHEEQYGDSGRIVGVLENYELNGDWKESFIYTYNNGMYIFFDTINDLNEYLFYGDEETKIRRSYVREEIFDEIYDSPIEDGFAGLIKWF